MLAAPVPATPLPHDFNLNWKGPRSRVSKAKVKPGVLRAMKGEADSKERNLTLIDVMLLLLLRERGPATTKELRDLAWQTGLILRVPKHRRKRKDICKVDEADGPDGRKRGFYTGIMSRCYKNYAFVDEIGILNKTREVVHQINDKGLAYLANRMNNYVPDADIAAVQLSLNGLNRRVQRKPPKDAALIDAIERSKMEAAIRTEFDAALSKGLAGTYEHHVYLDQRERPFIWRSDTHAPIRLDERHHPFHALYKHYVVEAALVRMRIGVTSDYDGGEGKPKAILISVRPVPTEVPAEEPPTDPIPVTPSSPPVLTLVPPPAQPQPAPVVAIITKPRRNPGYTSRQAEIPFPIVIPGPLSRAEIVSILQTEQNRVGDRTFVRRERIIRQHLMDAQNQIDAYIKREINTMIPVLVMVSIPSHDLWNPQNPYHYCAKPFFDYAELNGFVLEITQVSNGFTAIYRPKPKALTAP